MIDGMPRRYNVQSGFCLFLERCVIVIPDYIRAFLYGMARDMPLL